MPDLQKRIRTIQAFYSELALAETFKNMSTVNTYDVDEGHYIKKAEQHYRSATRLADYIAVQYKADLEKLPTMEVFLKS